MCIRDSAVHGNPGGVVPAGPGVVVVCANLEEDHEEEVEDERAQGPGAPLGDALVIDRAPVLAPTQLVRLDLIALGRVVLAAAPHQKRVARRAELFLDVVGGTDRVLAPADLNHVLLLDVLVLTLMPFAGGKITHARLGRGGIKAKNATEVMVVVR